MSAASLALVVGLAGAAAPPHADELGVIRRIAAAGAIDLALERIARLQPREPSAPQWIEWELLRLELLHGRGRDAEVLKRAAAARNIAMPDGAAGRFWLTAARAALRLGEPAQARLFFARYFLRACAERAPQALCRNAEPSAGAYREARSAVIDILLADGNVEDAYRSMLRFQQDFAPLAAGEVERFVTALVGAGRAADAASWLPQLDKSSPAAALLRLRAGLISPDTAIAQARALLAKGVVAPALDLLSAAAAMQKNRRVELESLEHRLDAAPAEPRQALERIAASLWEAYAGLGEQVANQAQLLVGDDGAWVERSLVLDAQQPQLARALLAAIAQRSRSEAMRARAQLQLILSLREGRRAAAALRLFAPPRFTVPDLQPAVRYELGALAAEQKNAAEAVRFWQGLPVPAGMNPQEWGLRYAAVLYAGGMFDEGLDAASALLAAPAVPSVHVVSRLSAIAFDALHAWQPRPAERLFALLAPHGQGTERAALLLGLARSREALGEFRAAADAFLHAAALAENPQADREALRARESGAVNLARAGLTADARETFRWLAAHAQDASIRERALRALR